MTNAQKWHDAVRARDYGICQAQRHDHRCPQGVGQVAHHIYFRSHTPSYTHWTVMENGIWLSQVCHDFAHGKTKESDGVKNANIPFERYVAAYHALNAVIPDTYPELKVSYPQRRAA